ncbi:MAG: hypothetical protein KDD62_01715 [Bdellovibrionales bacterium]|nr:hypothetical protein [Bdellovibrionales bacterium]
MRFQTADGDISFAERCVFLRPEDNPGLLSCVEAALQSNALPIIVAMCPELSLSASKRLSMLAEKHHSLLFLYRPLSAEKQKSFASSRWKILPYASKYQQLAWTLELLQSKGKKTIHNSWIIAQQAHTRFSLLEHDEVDDGHVSLHLLSPMAPAIRREARHAAAS